MKHKILHLIKDVKKHVSKIFFYKIIFYFLLVNSIVIQYKMR